MQDDFDNATSQDGVTRRDLFRIGNALAMPVLFGATAVCARVLTSMGSPAAPAIEVMPTARLARPFTRPPGSLVTTTPLTFAPSLASTMPSTARSRSRTPVNAAPSVA